MKNKTRPRTANLGHRSGRNRWWCLAVAICVPQVLVAATYTIDWHSIDGGSGESSGGGFSASGTIGQPVAGELSGGEFSLLTGFWSIAVPAQVPEAPALRVQAGGNQVLLAWPASATGFQLETTSQIAPPAWSLVDGTPVVIEGEHRILLTRHPGQWFFRLRKP
jgi:hypothetical protein